MMALLGILVAVVLFMINYLSMRLTRVEEGLSKKIRYWSQRTSEKAIDDIVQWMRKVLQDPNLESTQKEVFKSALKEYNRAIRDVTIMKLFLLFILVSTIIVVTAQNLNMFELKILK